MAEIITPLAERVLKNGESEFTFGPDHTVADLCRHIHGEKCAEEAIYILRELLGVEDAPKASVVPLVWEQMVDPAGQPTRLHRAWCPLFERYYWAERKDRIPKVEKLRATRILKVIRIEQGAKNG